MRGGYRWSLVSADVDTLSAALNVPVDDHAIPSLRRRPGRRQLRRRPFPAQDRCSACLVPAPLPVRQPARFLLPEAPRYVAAGHCTITVRFIAGWMLHVIL